MLKTKAVNNTNVDCLLTYKDFWDPDLIGPSSMSNNLAASSPSADARAALAVPLLALLPARAQPLGRAWVAAVLT